jgi:alpha-acetolactate decarboxylase
MNREIALGNSFRTKDGGKDFSQTNIDYLLQQKNWFAQDTPDTWRDYYQTKRTFSPYYDATKEVQEAMKNFKPSHKKTVSKDGFYLQVLDDKSWYEGEVAEYLNAVLSDKAKRQWQIEGAVKYGDNIPLLSQTLNLQAASIIPNVQTNIDDLNIKIRRINQAKRCFC